MCSRQYFLLVWKTEFPGVTLRTASRFSKCSVCSGFVNQLKACGTLDDRDAIWTEWMPHLTLQSDERAAYHRRRNKAVKHPEWFLSVACDTMDGFKTELPRLFDLPKHITSEDMLPTKLHGVLVHGVGLWLHHIPAFIHCTANMVCSTLMHTLMAIPAERRADRMYLQLDGASQNKCKTVMAFCAWLVKQGMFRQIKLSFLLVGHTHEDVDQCFCVISKHLRQFPVYTVEDLKREVLAAFSKERYHGNQFVPRKIEVRWMNHGANYDVTAWLEPHVDRSFAGFRFNSNCFKFVKYNDGVVRLHYKKYASDRYWKPILWTGDDEDIPVLHPQGHAQAGLPVQDTRHIVIMTGYPAGSTPPSWEPADDTWLQAVVLQSRLDVIIGPKFTNMIPRNELQDYVASWQRWFAIVPSHLRALIATAAHLKWTLTPVQGHELPIPDDAAAVESTFSQAAESSGLGESITLTGHSKSQEINKKSGRVFKRTVQSIPNGSLLALRKVPTRHCQPRKAILTCCCRMRKTTGQPHSALQHS